MTAFSQRIFLASAIVSDDCVSQAKAVTDHYEQLLRSHVAGNLGQEKLPSFFVEFIRNYYSDLFGNELVETALPIHWIGEFMEDAPIFGLTYTGELFSEGTISDSERIKYGLPEGIRTFEEYKLFVHELMKALDGKNALLGTTIKMTLPEDSFPREYVVVGAEQTHVRDGTFLTISGLGADALAKLAGSQVDQIWHRFHQTTEPYAFIERGAFERAITALDTQPNPLD